MILDLVQVVRVYNKKNACIGKYMDFKMSQI